MPIIRTPEDERKACIKIGEICEERDKYREALRRIAKQDYRGNRCWCGEEAWRVLEEVGDE